MVITICSLFTFWRALVLESFDPLFFKSLSPLSKYVHISLLGLVVLNLVGGFQSLGTLLSVGIMMIPAITARFWLSRLGPICILSILLGIIASICGLLLSFHLSLPSGPSIIIVAGCIYLFSCFISPRGFIVAWFPRFFIHSSLILGNNMSKLIQLFVPLGVLLLFTLFPLSATAYKQEKIRVVVSFSILADLVKNVGGDHISMTIFVGPNANTHTYEPTPQDAQALRNAHIIFINGLHLEGFIDRLITASGTKAPLIEASANISPLEIKNRNIVPNTSITSVVLIHMLGKLSLM